MIEVLLLGRKHGYERLRQAVEKALEVGCSDVGAVRYLLGSEAVEKRQPVERVDIGALKQYERPLPSLAEYDQLLTSCEVVQ